jgi:hypothetical protein
LFIPDLKGLAPFKNEKFKIRFEKIIYPIEYKIERKPDWKVFLNMTKEDFVKKYNDFNFCMNFL